MPRTLSLNLFVLILIAVVASSTALAVIDASYRPAYARLSENIAVGVFALMQSPKLER